jgi:homoserine kinase
VKARAPGSTSNLGPGYDVLGLALGLYIEVEILPAPELRITADGEGADLPLDASHLAAAVCRQVLGHDRVSIHVSSQIPVGRGLGSSAALAVAAAAASGTDDPLAVAAAFDGHAENAAASVLGGLVAATMIEGRATARRLQLDAEHRFVAVIPDRQLLTKSARAVLPSSVPLPDAVHNLGRLGLLIAGLADQASLVAAAGEDRLHQPYRAALYPEAPALMDALITGGATMSCWSGAGPTILAVCSGTAASAVVQAGEVALAALGLTGRAVVLAADTGGLTITG